MRGSKYPNTLRCFCRGLWREVYFFSAGTERCSGSWQVTDRTDLSTCFAPWELGGKKQNSGARGLICAVLKANIVPWGMQGKVVPSWGMCLYLGRELSPVFWLQKQNGLLKPSFSQQLLEDEQLHIPREGWMDSSFPKAELSRIAWARVVSSCLRSPKTSVLEVQGQFLGRCSPEPLTDSLILRIVSEIATTTKMRSISVM